MKDVQTLGIVGSGQMGGGIGQVAAQAGFSVVLFDVTQQIVNRSLENIQRGLVRLTERGKLPEEEQRAILGRLRGTANLNDMRDVDLVIEAAPEDYEIKKSISCSSIRSRVLIPSSPATLHRFHSHSSARLPSGRKKSSVCTS
jgi:3-hydroxyacyl-CoA dehydrogenase